MFFIIRRTSVFSFMHSKDSPFWRLQCQLVEPQCFLSLISSAWPNTSPSTPPLPRDQDQGGPPQIQRSPHWSSGMLSWNINHKCSGEKPSKKQRRLFPQTNYKLELEAQPVIFFLLRPALFSFRQLWSICAIHLGKGHELGTASWQGRLNSLKSIGFPTCTER